MNSTALLHYHHLLHRHRLQQLDMFTSTTTMYQSSKTVQQKRTMRSVHLEVDFAVAVVADHSLVHETHRTFILHHLHFEDEAVVQTLDLATIIDFNHARLNCDAIIAVNQVTLRLIATIIHMQTFGVSHAINLVTHQQLASAIHRKRPFNSGSSSSSYQDNADSNNERENKRFKQRAFVVLSQCSSSPSSAFLSIRSPNTSCEWILDGGASDHYVSDISLMTDIRTLSPQRLIMTANGTSFCNTSGTVVIRINSHREIILKDVLYVPDFNVNLISVYKVVCTGAEVTYKYEAAHIMIDGHIDITFPRRDNVYMLTALLSATSSSTEPASTPSSSSFTSTSSTISSPVINAFPSSNENTERIAEKIRLMHLKHGHVNYQRLLKMINKKSVLNNTNIRITNEREILRLLKSTPCDGCIKGKMKRTAMTGTIDYHINDIMDMWVFDTMIFTTPTISGCRYITLTIDVFSSEIFIGVHETKDVIADYLIRLIKRLQVSTGKTLKRLHSDNGTEVKKAKVKSFLDSQGTILTTCTNDTPQHNSIVERKNRTVIDSTSSMMHHAHAYLPLYGEAAVCSVHILNRTTNTRTELITPIAHRIHRKPDTNHLHVWGCDVDYHVFKTKRKEKFAAKSKPGIFVGYDENNDLYYRIFDIETHAIVITRDVIFHENRFTMMKRLRNEMNNTNDNEYHDEDITTVMQNVISDDYLPENINEEAIASMFDDGRRNENNIDNEDNNENDAIEIEQKTQMNNRSSRKIITRNKTTTCNLMRA